MGCAVVATGLVHGKWHYSTPCRIDTPQPITKTFVTGDYISDPYIELCQIWCTSAHGERLDEWVKYDLIFIYLFIYALFGNSATGHIGRRIITHDGSNDADSRRDVPFWVLLMLLPT